MQMLRLCLLVLVVGASVAKADFSWNGTHWVWQEEKNAPDLTNLGEGSGDEAVGSQRNSNQNSFDDEDDDDDYDYESSGDDDSYDTPYNPVVEETPATTGYDRGYDRGQDPYQPKEDDFYVDVAPPSTVPPPVDPPRDNGPGPVDHGFGYPDTTPKTHDGSLNRRPATSFFAQPGTLAAIVGGAVVGLLCAILCVMFVVYRMRKKDEGSYALDEPKRVPTHAPYNKASSREFYA